MKPFRTSAPEKFKFDGGYGGGTLQPSTLASEVFGRELSGPWLACYMLRRFGWPNMGSDDYKQFMTWALTTPIEGLYLSVTPYMAADGGERHPLSSNLHFGVLFTEAVGRKIDFSPGREAWFQRSNRFVMNWWETIGSKLYAWGVGKAEDDRDELIQKFCSHPRRKGLVFGLWKRTPKITYASDLPKNLQMVDWWLAQLIKDRHPEVKLPTMTKRARERSRGKSRACLQAEHALKRTMLDLCAATHVRDVEFNCYGRTNSRMPGSKAPPIIFPDVGFFKGAGNTPSYYYSPEGRAAAKKEAAKTLNKV
jgi:hypothetical protein